MSAHAEIAGAAIFYAALILRYVMTLMSADEAGAVYATVRAALPAVEAPSRR